MSSVPAPPLQLSRPASPNSPSCRAPLGALLAVDRSTAKGARCVGVGVGRSKLEIPPAVAGARFGDGITPAHVGPLGGRVRVRGEER